MLLPRVNAPGLYLLIGLLVLSVLDDAASSSSTVKYGPHLADVNILLPPKMTYPVEYRLQGSDGCFDWSWDHHDVLSVLPEYNSSSRCSTSALLKSIAPYSGRKETAVYATDLNSGMVIRCKVYIDLFSRIQIFHSSVKLDLEGLASLRVRAFDSEENVFSSLVGLQFLWQLKTEVAGVPHHLVHVPLKDSPQSDCGGLCGDLDIQAKLEDSGVFSDLFVVKGVEIGQEFVSVHLSEPSAKSMRDEVLLTVAEAMSLEPPSPVFVIVGAVVDYTLKVIRGNVPHVVSLPSPFHLWSISNSSVAQVDMYVGETRALNLGMTTVNVRDTRVVDHVQTSTLRVVLPDTLLLHILPLSPSGSPTEGAPSIPSMARWYVVSGRNYFVEVKVFTQRPGAEEIFITDSDDILIADDQIGLWNLFPGSDTVAPKKSIRILEAVTHGLGKLMAVLTYTGTVDNRKEVIKVVQEVMVCDEVTFIGGQGSGSLSRILLPWAPGVSQELELRVSGGCAMTSSEYKWFSSNTAVVSVSASGVIQSKSPGKATIKAASPYDLLNFDEMVVEVSTPSSITMLQNIPVEFPVGSHIQAFVTLKSGDGSLFERCDAFHSSIKWTTESDSFTIINSTVMPINFGEVQTPEGEEVSVAPPCGSTYVYTTKAECTMLHATLTKEYQHVDHSVGGLIALKASMLISTYNPLKVFESSDGNQFGGYWVDVGEAEYNNELESLDSLYLVPGTHFDVRLQGGPEAWDRGVEFIETVETLNEKDTSLNDGGMVNQEHANFGRVYRVKCEKMGKFKVVFKRGNLVGNDHPMPAVSEVHLLVMCQFPTSIVLLPDEVVNSPKDIISAAQADRMEGRIRATPITVANGRTIRLSAVGISDDGKAFGNSSSLQLNWNLNDCDGLAVWDFVHTSAVTKSSWERFLILQNSSGLCTVRSTVIGFVDYVSHLSAIIPFGMSLNSLTDAARLSIVASLKVNPEFSLLFFSNESRLNLSITGGSCFMETSVNDTRILEVIQSPLGLQCVQVMLAPKRLGAGLVTVHDIGISPAVAASSVVQVADLDWIKLMSKGVISIMQGTLVPISFMAGTDEGHVFDSSQYVFMKIHVHFEKNIIELVDDGLVEGQTYRYVRASNFSVRGTHLGVTTLYLSARQHSGQEILSQAIKVEVYSPPILIPDEIFLVPGASYVLSVKGGPKYGAFLKYSSRDDETAKFQKMLGHVTAISPGNATVVATFYGRENVVLCQAFARISVGVPTEALLNVQSEKLAVGRQVPIFPTLTEGNLFSFYELCSNFKWTIEDEEVLTFHDIQGLESGIPFTSDKLVKEDIGFLRALQGLSPGKTDVSVTFSCDFVSTGSFSESRLYSARLSLWVVPDLPLALGSPITWILPPHYTVSGLLPVTSNPHSKGDTSRRGKIAYSVLRDFGEEAQDDVISIDGGAIRTKEAGSLTCILAKDKSTGRIEIASCVRVAKVAQMRFMGDTALILKLAIGSEIHLPIKCFDVLGNPFHAAHNASGFEVETNHPHIVTVEDFHVSEGSIRLMAKGHGKALIRLSSVGKPQKSDYVMIYVGAHLHPLNPVLHLGSHLNFSINGLSGEASGHWFSANESIVHVNNLSGKAKAIAEGSTKVHYEGSDLKLHTVVTVIPGKLLTVEAPSGILTNAPPFPVKGYLFPVKLADVYSKMPIECEVDPPYVGSANPWSDPATGELHCILFPHFPEQLVRSAPENSDMKRGISVAIRASLREDTSVSGSASALFVGGFSLSQNEKSPLLNLTTDSNRGYITIVGNTDVQVTWHHWDKLSVREMNKEESKKGRQVIYEVKAHSDAAFKDELIISLQATGQRAGFDVSFEANGRVAPAVSSLRFLVGSFALWILCSLVAYLVYQSLHRAWPQRSQPHFPGSSSPLAPATPPATRLGVAGNEQSPSRSPSTPQPFLDYVRRTIDETPNYRQEFRRRGNLQNTL